jgi:hypothetical protein
MGKDPFSYVGNEMMSTKSTEAPIDRRFGAARSYRGWRTWVAAVAVVSALGSCLLAAGVSCIRMPTIDAQAASAPQKEGGPTYGPFKLKPDFAGSCARAEAVDVNLGNTRESFVRAAHCQITGEAAPAQTVDLWARRMRDEYYVRRIDVVRSLCAEHKRASASSLTPIRGCHKRISPALPERRTKRDIGAVFMFFFECPGHQLQHGLGEYARA